MINSASKLCWLIVVPGAAKVQQRARKPWTRRYLLDLWERRQLVGPEPPKPRSCRPNWNYDVELAAFRNRVGQQFSESNLRRAFLHRSFIDNEEQQRNDLPPDGDAKLAPTVIGIQDNDDLFRNGSKFMCEYVKAYLRLHLPKYPEEGIASIHDYVTSEEKLVTLTKHLGAYDLILADKYPYEATLVARTFQALVGALTIDCGPNDAALFVKDFVLSQLIEEDVNELWYFEDPWKILCAYLKAENMAPPEPRILREAGRNTVTPVYVVGIYSGLQLLGSSPGESEQIATEMASRDSLKRLWDSENVQFELQSELPMADVEEYWEKPNWTVADRLGINVRLDASLFDEPLKADRMTIFYKENVEKVVGTPYRRRLWHRFYPGTRGRKTPRRFIAPKAKTI